MTSASAGAIVPNSEHPAAPPLVVLVSARPEIRGLLTAYLLALGTVPLPAAGGAHADVICQAVAPDIVLIDLPLPDCDEVELVRTITGRRPGVPIAVCTVADAPREARYRAAGADEIVPKPLDLDALDRALKRLSSLRRRRR